MRRLFLIALLAAMSFSLMAETLEEMQARIQMLEEQVGELSKASNGQNLKWGIDYRVTHDSLEYTMLDGRKERNDSLLANRLIMKMGYIYNENLSFSGALAYNKAFGDGRKGTAPQRSDEMTDNFAAFDWITGENPNGNGLSVREASFLYVNNSFFGIDKLPWTFSIGRRPSTNGFLVNLREGSQEVAQSPLGHAINSEYDGLSLGWKFSELTGIEGLSFKFCAGRGYSNANSRYKMGSNLPAYVKDRGSDTTPNIDLAGFIFTPYNDGQYDLKTMYYYAKHLIGFPEAAGGGEFEDFGDLSGMTVSFQMNGIGNMINDYLDGIKLFASYSVSKTHPKNGMAMIGDTSEKTGDSYWFGANVPGFFKDSFGLEYNHGSRYWRSFSYAEDTMIGSKLATRGDAYEAYYNLPLIDEAFTFQVRYTYLKFDYLGSHGFFGSLTGKPTSIEDAKIAYTGPTATDMVNYEDASVLRFTFRYVY